MQTLTIKIGAVFGSLVTVAEAEKIGKSGRRYRGFLCLCSCGESIFVTSGNLRHGLSTQCRRCAASKRARTHGLSRYPGYSVWRHMNQRCHNPSDKSYVRYGARGIRVCPEWRSENPDGLRNFLVDMGPKPAGMSLDRIDNNKGYTPENCRWATARQQANNSRNNVSIDLENESRTLAEWARIYGIAPSTLRWRLQHGWDVKTAVTKPVKDLVRRDLTIDGVTRSQLAWANAAGIHSTTIQRRLQGGLRPKDAVFMESSRGKTNSGKPRRRHDNVLLTVRGKTKPVSEWAREVGVSENCIRYRLKIGWCHEDAVLRPSRKRSKFRREFPVF